MPNNQLQIADTLYDVTSAYVAGSKACRSNVPYHANPHRDGSQRASDWSYGHDNEAANFHIIDGQDVLVARSSGDIFKVPDTWVEHGGPKPEDPDHGM